MTPIELKILIILASEAMQRTLQPSLVKIWGHKNQLVPGTQVVTKISLYKIEISTINELYPCALSLNLNCPISTFICYFFHLIVLIQYIEKQIFLNDVNYSKNIVISSPLCFWHEAPGCVRLVCAATEKISKLFRLIN